ncbi:MAG: hypothetical protein CK548_01555 [Opitutia bacterium]|nr:hypothetical protein [Opitutaceae bacterium]PHX73352.1 MAG: hypothetical protein CK548_01555 [Opitutae bacterium]
MDISLESLSSFRPRTGTMEAWNAAYVRVEDYLRAHRIHNRLHQSRLILQILERAARRHEAHPTSEPTTLAAEETEAMMDLWFADVLDVRGQPHERIAVDGRVALLLSDGPEKWPYAFLDEQNIPVDFAQAMRRGGLQAGPDMAVSNMAPQPIDLGLIPQAAGETLEQFEKWPILRALLLWLLFAAALAGIFYATR